MSSRRSSRLSSPADPTAYSRPYSLQAAADTIPILVDDTYHLFHLTTPPNTMDHPARLRASWSRLRSKDLVNWFRDRQPVIQPEDTPEAPDADGCLTGSAVAGLDGRMHIFYNGCNLADRDKHVILHAMSSNLHGSVFVKGTSPITVISDRLRPSIFEDIDFRDPYVFYNPMESQYWMLVATRLSTGPYWTRGCIALLTSPDLLRWTLEPEPLFAPNDLFRPKGPELFSLPNGKWYLVYSRFSSPNAGTLYKVSSSPRGPFRSPRGASGERLDGRRWCGAKSCPKVDDPTKRIYFGWIADRSDDDGNWLWGGDLATPREVFAAPDGSLMVQPVEEFLRASFPTPYELKNGRLLSALSVGSFGRTSSRFIQFPGGVDYFFKFAIAAHDAAAFGLLFRTSKDMRGHRLRFEPRKRDTFDVILLTDSPLWDDFWADQYQQHPPREFGGPEIARHNNVKVRDSVSVVVRDNILEIFFGGRSISYRFPETSSPGEEHMKDSEGELNGVIIKGDEWAQGGSDDVQELGLFVEDGIFQTYNISLRFGVS